MLLFLVDLINIEKLIISFRLFAFFFNFIILRSRATSCSIEHSGWGVAALIVHGQSFGLHNQAIFPVRVVRLGRPANKLGHAAEIPTTPFPAVPVCQATRPLAWAKTRFPSVPKVNVAFSPTGFPRLASHTQRYIGSVR